MLPFAILTRFLIFVQFKQRLTISSTFDAVLGELSFRDGPYSTDRQVGYEVQGAVTPHDAAISPSLLTAYKGCTFTARDSRCCSPIETIVRLLRTSPLCCTPMPLPRARFMHSATSGL